MKHTMHSLDSLLPRDSYLTDISEKLAQMGRGQRHVVVFYGEEDLRWRLAMGLHRRLKDQGYLSGLVDGSGLKEHTASPLESGLWLLRSALGKGLIDFSCFDIAYWCYWSALNSQLAVDSATFARNMSRADQMSAWADLLAAGHALDLEKLKEQINLADMSETAQAIIPAMMGDVAKGVGNALGDAIPFGVFVSKLAWFLVGLEERRRRWWQERGCQDLRELRDCESPFDMLPYLPFFLARDLKQHFQQPNLPPQQQRAIIFVDDYDSLVDDKTGQCAWLQAMLRPEESSRHLLWVITASKPLPWLEEALQKPILPLTEAESDQVLQALGVPDPHIRQVITDAAQGSPFYFDVAYNYWQDLRQDRLPQAEALRQNLAKTLQAQDAAWAPDKRRLFQLLAVPRFWPVALVPQLLDWVGLETEATPIDTRLEILATSPYVTLSEDGVGRLHPQVREYFLTHQPEDQRQTLHQRLWEHYQAAWQANPSDWTHLGEALYHGQQRHDPQAAMDWLLGQVQEPIQQKRPHPALIPLLEQILAWEALLPPQRAWVHSLLGQAWAILCEWEAAQTSLETALQQWRTLGLDDTLPAAETYYAISEVYDAQENSFDSLKAAQQAARLLAQHHGETSIDYAEALSRQAEATAAQGKPQEALRLSDQATALATASPTADPLRQAQILFSAALVRCTKHTLDQAAQFAKAALAGLQNTHPGHPLAIRSQALLGDIYRSMGPRKGQAAFDAYQTAIDQADASFGPQNPYSDTYLEAQIKLCRKLGQHDQADALLAQHNLFDPSNSAETPLEAAARMNRVGVVLYEKGEFGKAEPRLKQSLAIRKAELGDRHPDTATSLGNLASLYESMGRYGEAEPLYIQALVIKKAELGDRHPDTATSLNNLAFMYKSMGRYGEAKPFYTKALEIRKTVQGDRHPDTATSLENLAGLYRAMGRYGEAEPLFTEALDICKAELGDRHPATATSLSNLAGLYYAMGRYGEAKPFYTKALEIRKTVLGDRHPDTATSLGNLALLYESMGRYGEAEPLYIQALAIKKAVLGDRHPATATSLNNLAKLYYAMGCYAEAEPLYIQALEIRKTVLGVAHPDVAASLNNLASLYESQGRYSEAEPLYVQTLTIAVQRLGENHPNTQTHRRNFVVFLKAVVAANQTHLLSNHPTTQALLAQLQP